MSGVSLPVIRGALPFSYKPSYTGLDLRPDSRSSNVSNFTSSSSNNASYDNCVFRTASRTLSRSYTKLPSLRGVSRQIIMLTVVAQKTFMPDALPDIDEPPRWPGKSQGKKQLPSVSRSAQRKREKTIGEMSDIVRERKEAMQLWPRKEISNMIRKQINPRPDDVPFSEYKLKKNIRERPMSEITIPPEWSRRKWDVAPIEGPFNIPALKSKITASASQANLETDSLNNSDDMSLRQQFPEKTPKVSIKFTVLPPPPEMVLPHQPVAPPQMAPSIRRQRIRPIRRPFSAQLPIKANYFDVLENFMSPAGDLSRRRLPHYNLDMVSGAAISEPGWGDRTVDKRFLEEAVCHFLDIDTSRAASDIHSRYSAKYRSTPDLGTHLTANSPFLPKVNSTSEECLKCLLKIPHKKCESHKYIRVGGGYRHGYWYVRCLLEELELQRQKEELMKKRLEAIKESKVIPIKTYIRTKSGRLVERIVFMNEEDFELFKAGKGAQDILNKYLSKEEAAGLESWDKDEVKAITTLVRTKSGRLIEKVVYVTKDEYDAITTGKMDAKDVLKKYAKDGETVEGWKEAKMKTIKTMVRTKSGRLIEKTIMISQEDYDQMIKEGKDPAEILKKYIPLEDGQKIEGWDSTEPMKAIKTKVRTKSGRIIEKTIMVSAADYDKLMAGGADMNDILGKYVKEEDGVIEGWEKAEGKPMKVIKTLVRTKSGRLVEKTVMLTEEEYEAFQAAGGDPEFLKKFMNLEKGEKIEDWEKASTVYDDDDPEVEFAKAGQRIVGKDGAIYEVVVDPLTGKKYKKKISQQESDVDSGIASMQKGKRGKKGKGNGLFDEDDETPEERKRRKEGKRNEDSDSEYSYRSVVSAGGTRHVQRRRKREDGTYSDPESYHSDKDAEGQARRRRRRREREHQNSAHSYYSVVSEGGTRHVKRKRKRADGTYSDSESYHSEDSHKEGGRLAERKKKEKETKERLAKEAISKKKKGKKGHDSDSDHSYYSEVSEGGTKRIMKKKKIRDAQGKVIGYGKAEEYVESSDDESVYTEVSDGKGGKMTVKKQKLTKADKIAKAKAEKKAKEAITKIKGGKFADVADFSDASTDSDIIDMSHMTEEEKKAYLEARAKRKVEREKRRREKYGDKYDLMVEKQKELKKLKKLQEMREKGLISPSSDWSIDSDTGEPVRKSVKKEAKKQKKLQELREKGLISPSSDWTVDSEGNPVRISELEAQGKRSKDKGGKGRKGKDGNEADDESDASEYDPITGKKIKKKKTTRPGEEGPDDYEYEYDDQGRVIKKKKKGGKGEHSGSEYEYEYDEDGNVRVVKSKKGGKKFLDEDSDGEPFEVGADGKIRLKDGKKKIDLSKITDDDLRKLGIDPSLSKKEIAKLLKEKFGDHVEISERGKKIGTRRASDYGSDVDTDDLADDSDLDVTTLKGTKKINVAFKRGGKVLQDHMKRILEQCRLQDDYAKDLDERDGDIDFLTHYKLVDPAKIESYARAFVVEDEDFDTVITSRETKQALEGVPSVQHMTKKQFEYVFQVLKIDDASQITFRMFAVISALCERVTQMDPISKYLLEICDLLDIQRKMDLYRAMFYCNAESDRDANFIKAESLRIELIAGGLNWKQQEYIMDRLQPNAFFEISFLDYLCYVPLFLSMHENIVDNPLDMSSDKYDHLLRKPSGGHRQRDMNPSGYPLRRESVFQLREQAKDLLDGKINPSDLKEEKVKLLRRVATLPQLIEDTQQQPVSNSPPPMIWS